MGGWPESSHDAAAVWRRACSGMCRRPASSSAALCHLLDTVLRPIGSQALRLPTAEVGLRPAPGAAACPGYGTRRGCLVSRQPSIKKPRH